MERLSRDTKRPLLAGEDRRGKLEAMAHVRAPLYREIADLRMPGEHEGVTAASERCLALLDQHWQRQQAA